jgi:membrane associated rhomboid family serine protease
MFLPLKDHNPTERTAVVTIGLIAINGVVFLYELTLGPHLQAFIAAWGAVPYEITHMTDLVGQYGDNPFVQRPGPPFIPLTVITSMFMHGGVMHIFGNMLFLWIFGNNVEDLLGPVKYLFFYLACGVAAALAHIAIAPNSLTPTVGASGAVAGVLGAYLIAWPRARVLTLVFLIIFVQFVDIPAALLLVLWFAMQFFMGLGSLGAASGGGGVAWFAHVGGFVAGIILVGVLAPGRLRRLREARHWQDLQRRGF